ncbi:MerR family transcriptional regulator [Candidatus Peregrinibacteria bacterium]|nr:MerR family transcriptional regulator [Candidatus Peregrinibacteria bacterium]
MEKKLLFIGEAAKLIGVSIDTLRKWEKKGILQSFRPSLTSKRYYRQEDIDQFLSKDSRSYVEDLVDLAKTWAFAKSPAPLSSSLYCQTSDVFNSRLQSLELELARMPKLKDIFPLVIAVIGEIGSNSYNHNIGNWPDVPGIFFGYDIQQQQVVLADRGQGIYKTLKRVAPNLKNDKEALYTAFTKYISSRAPEERGNGLKFVKDVIISNPLYLQFYTGNASLELRQNISNLKIKTADTSFHGCIAVINF